MRRVSIAAGMEGTRRTVGDGRYEAVDGNGPIEYHLGAHGLLAHEIAARCGEKEGEAAFASAHNAVGELDDTYLRTRASDVRPAIAMPTWSSMRNIFC